MTAMVALILAALRMETTLGAMSSWMASQMMRSIIWTTASTSRRPVPTMGDCLSKCSAGCNTHDAEGLEGLEQTHEHI